MQCDQGKRTFVTGSTGCVGRAFIRQFVDTGREAVCLTRNPRRVAADMRSRVQIVRGEMGSVSSWLGALAGCDTVVHCAKADHADSETRAREDLAGTVKLLDASIRAGVIRFLQLSTISVYGITPDVVVDETFPRQSTTDAYSRARIRIEHEVLARKSEIQTVVLQPANVYGPGPCWWSHSLLNLMRRGQVILVNDGQGLANMVHVEDLAHAMNLALDASGITEECFIISDGRPVSWREYYEGLEEIAGRNAILALSADEARLLSRQLSDRSLVARARRWLRRALLDEPIVFPVADLAIDKFACKTVFSIEKARRLLHYEPRYDLRQGLETVKAYEHHSAS